MNEDKEGYSTMDAFLVSLTLLALALAYQIIWHWPFK